MRVRRVDNVGDMMFGGDQASFWYNQPEGVAQVVVSRLNLWETEWYLDLAEGTPYQTQVLGKRTENTRDPVLQDRILGTPGATELKAYDSVLDRNTRQLKISATVGTLYSRNTLYGGDPASAEVNTSVYEGR